MTKLIIVRNQATKRFIMIDSSILSDPNMSYTAKGLYAVILDFPKDKRLSLEALKEYAMDTTDSIQQGLKELEALGYIEKGAIT